MCSSDLTLVEFKNNTAVIETAKGKQAAIPFEKIKKANLKFEW